MFVISHEFWPFLSENVQNFSVQFFREDQECFKLDLWQILDSFRTAFVIEVWAWSFQKTVNSADIGSEAEFDTQGHKIKAVVSGDASSLALKAVSGYLSATAKIVDGKLVESVTHNESGQTVTSTWERQ